MKTEVLRVLVMKIQVMWHMTTCRLLYGYRCFRHAYCLHLQGSPKPCLEYPENSYITGNYIWKQRQQTPLAKCEVLLLKHCSIVIWTLTIHFTYSLYSLPRNKRCSRRKFNVTANSCDLSMVWDYCIITKYVELVGFVCIVILHILMYTLFAQNVVVVCVIVTLNAVGRMLKM